MSLTPSLIATMVFDKQKMILDAHSCKALRDCLTENAWKVPASFLESTRTACNSGNCVHSLVQDKPIRYFDAHVDASSRQLQCRQEAQDVVGSPDLQNEEARCSEEQPSRLRIHQATHNSTDDFTHTMTCSCVGCVVISSKYGTACNLTDVVSQIRERHGMVERITLVHSGRGNHFKLVGRIARPATDPSNPTQHT